MVLAPSTAVCRAAIGGIALVVCAGCALDTTYIAAGDAASRIDSGADSGGGTDARSDASFDGGSDARSDSGGTDAGTDGGGTDSGIDGGIAALGPFAAPTLIAALSDPAAVDDDPTVTGDLLELYFNSNRMGGVGAGDVWMSTRPSPIDPWGAPTVVMALSTVDGETTPEVAADGLTIYLASNRPGAMGVNDIWVSTRATRAATWSAPVLVPELNSVENESSAAPNATALFMVLSSSRLSMVDADLFLSSRPMPSGSWSVPAAVVELNTTLADANPFLSPQGLHIFWDSDRLGGLGARDFYLASRLSTSAPFGAPVPISELNTIASDSDAWLSDDLRYMVFASTRSGEWEIYETSR